MSMLFRWRVRLSRTPVRRPLVWIRNLGLDADDAFLASFPRSGNTMLRFMLGEALSGTPATFETIQQMVPEIGVHVNAWAIVPNNGRLIKTHEKYCSQYQRVVYVYRDVRDALLSSFAREASLQMLHIKGLDDYIRPFMEGRMTHYHCSWQEHVTGFLDSPLQREGRLHVVSFERMRKDLYGTLAGCIGFLGAPVDSVRIQTAIANNTLAKMRDKEDTSVLPKASQDDGRWIGKGAVLGWQDKLTDQQNRVVQEYAGETLARLGYPVF
jgi:hypothetical protein